MPRVTVDVEALLVELLQALFVDEVTVRSEVDNTYDPAEPLTDAVLGEDGVPLILVRGITGRMVQNGDYRLGWEWTVGFSIIGAGRDLTADIADALYQAVHGFHEHGAAVEGVGWVSSVDDVAMPARTFTQAVHGQDLVAYDATFAVRVRPDTSL